MITIASTRFNNETYNENMTYKRENQLEGCIYGIPIPISEKIPLNSWVIICEMNNSINKIMGFGLIQNYLYVNKYHKIYSKGNYNRFTYQGKYYINRDEINQNEQFILEDLEKIVFNGKGHLKRGFGITTVPDKKMKNLNYNITKEIAKLFLTRFHILN